MPVAQPDRVFGYEPKGCRRVRIPPGTPQSPESNAFGRSFCHVTLVRISAERPAAVPPGNGVGARGRGREAATPPTPGREGGPAFLSPRKKAPNPQHTPRFGACGSAFVYRVRPYSATHSAAQSPSVSPSSAGTTFATARFCGRHSRRMTRCMASSSSSPLRA